MEAAGRAEIGRRQILVTGLRVPARIGWTEDERAVPQLLVLDLVLDLLPAPADEPADDLTGTVDYAALTHRVGELVARSSRRLLESLAADVLADVLRDRLVDAATVTVHKPAAPLSVEVDDVAVVLRGHSRQRATSSDTGSDTGSDDRTGRGRGTGGRA